MFTNSTGMHCLLNIVKEDQLLDLEKEVMDADYINVSVH